MRNVDVSGPSIGERAPDFTVTDRQGKTVRLSDFLGKTVVLETGSLKCPIFGMVMGRMNAITKQFPTIVPIALYVRGADDHAPLPAHLTTVGVEKLTACAEKALATLDQENHTIVADHLDPAGQQTYEKAPNMMYVINKQGIVVYVSDWLLRDLYAPHEVEQVLLELEGQDVPEGPEKASALKQIKASWFTFWH